MRYVVTVLLLGALSLSYGNPVFAQPGPADAPQHQKESYQRDVYECMTAVANSLRIGRDNRENIEEVRKQLRRLDALMLAAPAFVLRSVNVPDRIQPFLDDARNRQDAAGQILSRCVRYSQAEQAAQRAALAAEINEIYTTRFRGGRVSDDPQVIANLEGVMRRRIEEERVRIESLTDLHNEYLRIVARMTKLNSPVAGEFEGTFRIDPKKTRLVVELNGKRQTFPAAGAQQVGFIRFTVRGTEVTGEAIYGEEAGRAVIRLKGRYDLQDEKLDADDDGGQLPSLLPAEALGKIELKVLGKPELIWPGKNENRPLTPGEEMPTFDGTWRFRLADVRVTYQENEKTPVETLYIVELVAEGTWDAGRLGN